MLRIFLSSKMLSMSLKANHFIYWLHKIPVLKRYIPQSLYAQFGIKRGIGIIATIFSILYAFFCKALYILVFFYVLSRGAAEFWNVWDIATSVEVKNSLFMFQFFILSFLWGSIFRTSIKESNDYVLVRLIGLNPSIYYKSALYIKLVQDGLFFFILFLIFGMGFFNAIFFTLALLGSRLMGEVISLFEFSFTTKQVTYKGIEKYNTRPLPKLRFVSKSIFMVIPSAIITLAITYIIPYKCLNILNFSPMKFSIILFVIFGVIGIFSYIFLMNYSGYTTLARCLIRLDDVVELEDLKYNSITADIQLTDKDKKRFSTTMGKFNHLTGYEYLNAIFFERHYHMITAPMRRRIIINLLIIIAGIIASFIPFVREKDGLWTVIAGITPFLVFLMYLESTASRTVKAFFFNCDISLLKYGYYREKNAILENFKIRTKYLIKLALIPSFILSIGIIIITVLCGHSTDLHIAIPIAITILLLSIFFAMFHLLLYYLMQPYTEDNSVKSPLFSFLNGALYFICYICTDIETTSIFFTIGVLFITLIFIPVSYILILKFAPKTFKIR